MPDFEDIAKKAEGEVREHPQQAENAINRGEQEVDKATGNRADAEVRAAGGEAEKLLGGQDGQQDGGTQPTPPPQQ